MNSKRDNLNWLNDLQSPGEAREAALSDLISMLQRALPAGLSRWLSPDNPHFDELIADVIQETLIRVIDKLHTFEGRSQFTSWAYKIAARVALNELRHRRWKNVSMDGLDGEDENETSPFEFPSAEINPESAVERGDMLALLERILAEELTERQRAAMRALMLEGAPLEETARRMGTNRNALYKLMHDARLRLRKRLAREGLSIEELLGMFSNK
jgi:RNA polymerase sigma-70 factor (ECF subfamily)